MDENEKAVGHVTLTIRPEADSIRQLEDELDEVARLANEAASTLRSCIRTIEVPCDLVALRCETPDRSGGAAE